MKAPETTMHCPPPPSRDTTSVCRRPAAPGSIIFMVWRGPVLWSFGVSLLLCACIVLWNNSVATPLVPVVLAATIGVFAALTVWSGALFWNDVYKVLLQPKLQPAAAAASNWSLDDVLTMIFDPTQCAAGISALVMLPVTLYTLPTTPEQRAQVLQAAGLLPDADDSVLTQAGGWKRLLPEMLQLFLQRIENDGCLDDPVGVGTHSESEAHHKEGGESTVDNGDDYFPYSASPVYKATPTRHPPSAPSFEADTAESSTRKEPERDAPKPHTAQRQKPSPPPPRREPHDLLAKLVVDLIQSSNWMGRVCDQLQEQQTAARVTAVATAAVLVAQMRYSGTARACVKSVAHLLLAAGAGTALAGSVAALVAPYVLLYHGRKQQQQQAAARQQQTTNTDSDSVSGGQRETAPLNFSYYVALVSSFAAAATTAFMSIPRSPADRSKPFGGVAHVLVQWKGTVAALVLAYFQYRRRQRLQREARQTAV